MCKRPRIPRTPAQMLWGVRVLGHCGSVRKRRGTVRALGRPSIQLGRRADASALCADASEALGNRADASFSRSVAIPVDRPPPPRRGARHLVPPWMSICQGPTRSEGRSAPCYSPHWLWSVPLQSEQDRAHESARLGTTKRPASAQVQQRAKGTKWGDYGSYTCAPPLTGVKVV